MYYSDMYASKVVPDSFKEDPVLWGKIVHLISFRHLDHTTLHSFMGKIRVKTWGKKVKNMPKFVLSGFTPVSF